MAVPMYFLADSHNKRAIYRIRKIARCVFHNNRPVFCEIVKYLYFLIMNVAVTGGIRCD